MGREFGLHEIEVRRKTVIVLVKLRMMAGIFKSPSKILGFKFKLLKIIYV